MSKKLTIEVDADVSKAKKRLQKDLGRGIETPGGSAVEISSKKAAEGLEKVATSASKFSSAAENTASKMGAAVKMFSGMAIQMASSYAANHLDPTSMAGMSMSIGGNMFGGAMSGAAFGPWGAIAGALLGAGKGALENLDQQEIVEKQLQATKEAWEQHEKNFEYASYWAKKLKELSNITKKNQQSQIKAIEDELRFVDEDTKRIKGKIERDLAAGNMEEVAKDTAALDRTRSIANSLGALLENAKKKIDEIESPRSSTSALNALARIGGGNTGKDYGQLQVDLLREAVIAMQSIDSKTKSGGGATWQ